MMLVVQVGFFSILFLHTDHSESQLLCMLYFDEFCCCYLPSITVLGKHEQWSAHNARLSEVYFIYYFRACRDLFPATRAIKDMVKTDQVATVFVQGLQINGFPLSLSLPCLRLKLTCGNTSWCPIKERETRRCHLSFFPPYSSLYIYIYSFVVSVLEDLKT